MKLNNILKTDRVINLFKKDKREKKQHNRVVYINNRKPTDEDDITNNIKLPKYAGNRIKTSKVG